MEYMKLSGHGLSEQRRVDNRYPYVGHSFNSQHSTRFIFSVPRIGKIIEASVYRQLMSGNLARAAIEVSSMYGCGANCIYCASGNLNPVAKLTEEEISGQIILLARHYSSENSQAAIHGCFQGIGEPTLMHNEIKGSIARVLDAFPDMVFKISSMLMQPENLEYFADRDMPWDALQISLPHYDELVLRHIFGFAGYSLDASMDAVCSFRRDRPDVRIKINYTGLQGINDDDVSLEKLAELLAGKGLDDVEVKFSFLNPTVMTHTNSLEAVTEERLKEMSDFMRRMGFVSYVFGPMKNISVGCGQLVDNEDR